MKINVDERNRDSVNFTFSEKGYGYGENWPWSLREQFLEYLLWYNHLTKLQLDLVPRWSLRSCVSFGLSIGLFRQYII